MWKKGKKTKVARPSTLATQQTPSSVGETHQQRHVTVVECRPVQDEGLSSGGQKPRTQPVSILRPPSTKAVTFVGDQPTGSKSPLSGTEPYGSQSPGSTSSGTQPTGYRPPGSQPFGSHPSGSQPSGYKPSGTQPFGSQPSESQFLDRQQPKYDDPRIDPADDSYGTIRNINKVRISGSGVHGTDVTVHEPAGFTVSTVRLGCGDIIVSIIDPGGQKVPVGVDELQTGIFQCMYTPTTPGLHTMFVIFKGLNVKGSPFKVIVNGRPPTSSVSSNTPPGSVSSASSSNSRGYKSPVSPLSSAPMWSNIFNPSPPPSLRSITREQSRRPSLPNLGLAFSTAASLQQLQQSPLGSSVEASLNCLHDTFDPFDIMENTELLQSVSLNTKQNLAPCIQKVIGFELGRMIGEGQYGAVWEARYTDTYAGSRIVAAKGLKDRTPNSATRPQLEDFLHEPILMKKFKHENVLELLAVIVHDGAPYIVMPLMTNGNVQTYVEKHNKSLGTDVLLGFALHIAKGMEYIAALKITHRDLAARNCMLDGDLVVKVSDFGLARDTLRDPYVMIAKEKTLPIRWMAPEVHHTLTFNTETDVWAFGVTLWEIFTFGEWPYDEVSNRMICQYVSNGNRLRKPPTAGDDLYCLMLNCWEEDPGQRPSFNEIVQFITGQLDSFILRKLQLDSQHGYVTAKVTR